VVGHLNWIHADDAEMPTLGTARQKPLGSVRGDGLQSVQATVRILQRYDQTISGIAAQTQRCDLFADEIGMVRGSRTGGGPDTGCTQSGLISLRD
jgi:hypothetical protein